VEICDALTVLVDEVGFPPEDIILTRIFLPLPPALKNTTTTRWTSSDHALDQKNLPGAKVSGGVSTCPSVFAATTSARERSTVFLYHAIQAGMDMGIVNAGMVGVYDDPRPTSAGRLKTWC
jgi:5-methyltetrahydrofolate--homocysteine methyltransferase